MVNIPAEAFNKEHGNDCWQPVSVMMMQRMSYILAPLFPRSGSPWTYSVPFTAAKRRDMAAS